MNVRSRLKLFIKHINSKNSSFEAEFGLSNGYINNISRSIGIDLLEKISNKYPDLDIEWLLLGRGEMLKPGEKTVNTNKNTGECSTNIANSGTFLKSGNDSDQCEAIRLGEKKECAICKEKDRLIKSLEDQIKLYAEILGSKR